MSTFLHPSDFPRRILLCVTGMSPQIVTETLYALAVRAEPAFVPTELHLISTAEGLERARLMLLDPGFDHLHRLRADYDLPEIAVHLHAIGDAAGQPLADIRTPQDNAAAANAISRLLAELTADPDAAVHVSIAGGRKTMGYYLGYCLSLYGRPQDRLSHVLVKPDYESLPDFFYPTPETRVLLDRRDRPLDAAKATVDLAEIPFVSLREHLPARLLEGASFADAIRAAGQAQIAPHLTIDIARRTVCCNDVEVELSPQTFAYYAWIAWRCLDEVAPGGLVPLAEFNSPSGSLREGLRLFGEEMFGNEYEAGYDHWQQWKPGDFSRSGNNWISLRFNDVNKRLDEALGPFTARPFRLVSEKIRGNLSGHRLLLEPEQITLVERDPS